MSIHRLLIRLFSAFCGEKANENVKHFVCDLTCDVTGDPGVNFFFQFQLKDLVQGYPLPFEFPTSIGYRMA